MIRTEIIEGGLIRTWSDAGVLIHGGFPEGDYESAIDPADAGRTYTETDIQIDDSITAEEALAIITGEVEA